MNDIDIIINKNKIIDITYKYCFAIDTKNWDLLDNIFTKDATALLDKQTLSGISSIKNTISKIQIGLKTQHNVTNHIIEISNDFAESRCEVVAFHVKESAKNQNQNFILYGRYIDNLIKINDEWKIKHRWLDVLAMTGDPSILVGMLSDKIIPSPF